MKSEFVPTYLKEMRTSLKKMEEIIISFINTDDREGLFHSADFHACESRYAGFAMELPETSQTSHIKALNSKYQQIVDTFYDFTRGVYDSAKRRIRKNPYLEDVE